MSYTSPSERKFMQIQGKTIIVTGASEGIGRSIALALAKKGAHIALVARNAEKLAQVLSEVGQLGATKSQTYVCDVQDLSAIHTTAQQIISDFGSDLIGLVNNAGVWQKKAPLDQIPDNEINSVVQTDLLGVIHMTKAFLPHFRTVPEASIINISSRSGVTAQANQSVYSATKWGIRGFTQVLKEDLVNTNIHIAGIYQGGTNTQMFNKAGEDFSAEKLASFIPAEALGDVIATMLALPPQIWLSEIHVENR